MADPLVDLYSEWNNFSSSSPGSRPDVSRRLSFQLEQRFLARLFDVLPRLGDTARRTKSPDIVVTPPDGAAPLGIEIKVWSLSQKNYANRVSDALSQSVQARRAFSETIALDLVLLVLPHLDDEHSPEVDLLSRASDLLSRPDGVGYDNIYVGFSGPSSRWVRLGAHESLEVDFEGMLQLLQRELRAPKPVLRRSTPSGRVKALLVSDEWGSSLGGVSTLNRELAIGLSGHGFEVSMLLPSFEADEEDAATDAGVTLYRPDSAPGISGATALLSPATYPPNYVPDVIVGHGRVLGPYAFAVQNNQFPGSKRLHIVHTDSERLEAVKDDISGRSRMQTAIERRNLGV